MSGTWRAITPSSEGGGQRCSPSPGRLASTKDIGWWHFLSYSDGLPHRAQRPARLTVVMFDWFAFIDHVLHNIYEAKIIEWLLCARHQVEPWKDKGKCNCLSFLSRRWSLPAAGQVLSGRRLSCVGHLWKAGHLILVNKPSSVPQNNPLG